MKVLVACPTYNGWRANTQGLLDLQASGVDCQIIELPSSALTLGFNVGWAKALTDRQDGTTHFLLLHADVCPKQPDWFGRLYAEMTSSDADVISSIIPIKTINGLTSTAIDTDQWRPWRLTMAEVAKLPVTWTHPKLLLNTGMMLVKLGPWCESIKFEIDNRVTYDGVKWSAGFEPEDWRFSRDCHKLGVKLYATRAVSLVHRGEHDWSNQTVWGMTHDELNDPYHEHSL